MKVSSLVLTRSHIIASKRGYDGRVVAVLCFTKTQQVFSDKKAWSRTGEHEGLRSFFLSLLACASYGRAAQRQKLVTGGKFGIDR